MARTRRAATSRSRSRCKDGAGNRLHAPGSLPSYNEVVFGANPAGIQYYRAFFDPTTTYWRRKHRERMLMTQILGPAQNTQPIRTMIDLDDVPRRPTTSDHRHARARRRLLPVPTFPTAQRSVRRRVRPAHAGWAAPVRDTWTYHVPADAAPGTYLVTVKGRRVYLGEDIPATKTIEIQVGSPQRTQPR